MIVIPNRDATGYELLTTKNVAEDDQHRVRHKGIFDFTVNAGVTHDEDWLVEQLTYQGQNVASIMVGVRYHIDGGNNGDHLTFSVIDKDNILGYGANTILDSFAENFYIFPNEVAEIREHKADLIAGLYIRCHYVNTGASQVRFIGNLLRYLEL